jgi:hypothetical protein
MRSQARIEAGRRNGMLAKGKKSEEARQKCAQNRVKHGLFSKTLVVGQFEMKLTHYQNVGVSQRKSRPLRGDS